MTTIRLAIGSGLVIALVCAHAALAQQSARYQTLLDTLLQARADILDEPIRYPRGTPEVTAAVVTIPPGGETGWHTHEVPLFVQILAGEVTVDYGARGTRRYETGASFMEAMNWPHNGTNTGSGPVEIMAVYMGSDRRTNAETVPAPQ